MQNRHAPQSVAVPDLNDVPGWFSRTDQWLFERILRWQSDHEPLGGLVELGVYHGKSAIHMGRFRRTGEDFTVCDLFDLAGSESSILPGARQFYASLTQEHFESNYLRFHRKLPNVIRGMTGEVAKSVERGSCRFIHIDASHRYEHVRDDALMARELLRPSGVVVFDDYRTEHTLGTTAAVWEAAVRNGLRPIYATAMKLYATWGDPEALQIALPDWTTADPDYAFEEHPIFDGQTVVRVARVADDRPMLRRVGSRVKQFAHSRRR